MEALKLMEIEKMPWNLDELRELIETIHGPEQLEKAELHINSIATKLLQANYHARLARECIEDIFKNEESPAFVMDLILGVNEKSADFEDAKFASEANIIACAYVIHSISDVLAHLILDALAINGSDEDFFDFSKINKLIPAKTTLKILVTRVLGMHQFSYLKAYVNTSKHVSMIDADYRIDLRCNGTHGIRFKQFVYKKDSYKAKWSKDFIDEMSEIAKLYRDIGVAINTHLKTLQRVN